MPRTARVVIPGLAHHVTQRGNYRQKVFECQKDFRNYCYWIHRYSRQYNVEIMAYCLMPNHVHFIVVPSKEDSLANLFSNVHMRYSQYKHHPKRLKGHLWQGRFFSCVLGPEHLYRAVRYVERNPVRANIALQPWVYVWSSAREHVGLEKNPIFKTGRLGSVFTGMKGPGCWKKYLEEDDDDMAEDIRKKTQKGLVVGDTQFIIQIEQRTGRYLRERKIGRPQKFKKEGAVPNLKKEGAVPNL